MVINRRYQNIQYNISIEYVNSIFQFTSNSITICRSSRSRSCHTKSELLLEDNYINTSHLNKRRKTDAEVTMSCSSIQVSPKPLTGRSLILHQDTVLCGFKSFVCLDSQIKRTNTLRKFQAKRGMKNTFQVADFEQTKSILDNLRALSTTFWRDQLAGVVLCITSLCRIIEYFEVRTCIPHCPSAGSCLSW